MTIVRQAKDISEAIEYAKEVRARGEWNLFRGQSNAEWFVTSSFERLDKKSRQQADAQIRRFAAWADNEPSMKEYWKEPDSLLAIAQHYGLKTQFIDFTDDPVIAGFFACDSTVAPIDGQQAAIIGVNTEDFLEFWKRYLPMLRKKHPEAKLPEFIRINVANLWRLQTQQGSFLWNPIHGIEGWYDFDRIVFPYAKVAIGVPPRNKIYPENQSVLEQKLTRFFMNERMIEASKVMKTLKPSARVTIRSSPKDYEARYWWPSDVEMPAPWATGDEWSVRKVEHADHALPGTAVDLGHATSLVDLGETIKLQLQPEFIEANRERSLSFKVSRKTARTPDYIRIAGIVRRVWDGMRILPYTAAEIHRSLERTIEILPEAVRKEGSMPTLGRDSVYVEMAFSMRGDGAYSRGAITRQEMYAALNTTFSAAATRRTGRPVRELAEKLLLLPARPWQRFSFDGFRRLFVEELIPTQVAWRIRGIADRDLGVAIFFSPLEPNVFGLA